VSTSRSTEPASPPTPARTALDLPWPAPFGTTLGCGRVREPRSQGDLAAHREAEFAEVLHWHVEASLQRSLPHVRSSGTFSRVHLR